MSEWFYVKPILRELSGHLSPVRGKGLSQADLFAVFLTQNEDLAAACVLVKAMIVTAVNSSLIERGYAWLKGIKTKARNGLDDKQLERLLILAMCLPESLSKIDIDLIISKMKDILGYLRVLG